MVLRLNRAVALVSALSAAVMLLVALVLAAIVAAPVAEAASWTVQSVPVPKGPTGSLSAVNCASATACTAVGHYTNGAGVQVTLAERWNGTGWSLQSTPNPSSATS